MGFGMILIGDMTVQDEEKGLPKCIFLPSAISGKYAQNQLEAK